MNKYGVYYYDYKEGIRLVDIVEIDNDYTVEDYVRDCKAKDNEHYNRLLENGEFRFFEEGEGDDEPDWLVRRRYQKDEIIQLIFMMDWKKEELGIDI